MRERKRGGWSHFTLHLFRLVTAYQKFALLWEHLLLRPLMCFWQGEAHYTVSKRVNVCVFVSEWTRCPEGLCQFLIPMGNRLQVILERKTLSNQMETTTLEPPRRRWNWGRRWPCSEESLSSLGRSLEQEYSSLRREFWRTLAVWECHWWCGLPVGFSLFSVSVTHNIAEHIRKHECVNVHMLSHTGSHSHYLFPHTLFRFNKWPKYLTHSPGTNWLS